jgi:hypothetical protein
MTAKYPVTPERVTMYDSVNAASLPASTIRAAGYINGDYASHAAIAQRFPRARVFAIDVLGDAWRTASILDYEAGNPAYKNPALVHTFISNRNQVVPETWTT